MLYLDIALIVGLLTCFAGSVVLSAAEVSIIRVRFAAVAAEADAGSARAIRLVGILADLPVLLNTILLVALGLQVTAATTAGVLADRWLGRLGVTATTVGLTLLLFVYAEAIPKTWAIRSPQVTALRLTPVLVILVGVLRPAVTLLVWFAGLHTRGGATAQSALTETELRALARESALAGTIEDHDAELLARSFEFNDRTVGEIMVPRASMVTVEATASVAEALDRAVAVGHRRLPVRATDHGGIVGVVRLRDLAAAAATNQATEVAAVVSSVLRSTPCEPISRLLRRMQVERCWIAIVVEDGGETVGLATVEDLVAELVGEIEDDRPKRPPSDPS